MFIQLSLHSLVKGSLSITAKTEPFDKYVNEYEKWFEENRPVYDSELEAVRHFIPAEGKGIEVGIGTGRFAIPLNIAEGIEPSAAMRNYSERLGLRVFEGVAENLPLENDSYDFVLMVTTICFVDDIKKAFREAWRALKPDGILIIGLLDKGSPLGRMYEKMKDRDKFYHCATFFSADEVKKLLEQNCFGNIESVQTVFGDIREMRSTQHFKEGHGEGGFVVIKASKK